MKENESTKKLQALLAELKTAEDDLAKGGVTKERRDEIEKKFEEAKELQKEVDLAEGVFSFNGKMREIPETSRPESGDERQKNKGRGAGVGEDGSPIVGYATLGDLVTRHPAYLKYVSGSMSKGTPNISLEFAKGITQPLVAVTEKMIESKAIPTLGDTVIRPDRIALVVQETSDTRTVLRDVLNISQTTGTSVEYLVEGAYVEAAEPVAPAAAKPEATMALTVANAPVRTLAVHMPVTEQMLADIPQIRNLIDNRLTYDLRRLEEKQFLYGSGSGQNLAGILPMASVALITRSAPSDTQNLDRIRIGITDVLVDGGEPNAVVIHPLDWEGIVLLKESTKGYIWVVVTDPQTGNSRVWGLSVVETVAAKNPAATQRYMLVGDFKRGATVWDRQKATVEVGWIDDQFILNMRTIRAEERLAFGVHNPKWFKKYETAA